MQLYQKFDRWVDGTSMYRVLIYMLAFMWAGALVVSVLGKIPFSFGSIFGSFILLVAVAFGAHELFRRIYGAPANIESSLITAGIIFFVAKPAESLIEVGWLALLAFIAISMKYVVAYHNRHIFNPAALALVISGVLGAGLALWWVATPWMFPLVVLAGLTIVKKTRRWAMVFMYLGVSFAITFLMGLYHHEAFLAIARGFLLSWPAIYLACFMLTEPLSIPPTQKSRLVYAALVAVVGSLPIAFGNYGMTPELALLVGNLFAFSILMKSRIAITLKERIPLADNTEEFVFVPNEKFAHEAGQYLEWTLPQDSPDARGIRRYFTIASAPGEDVLRLGTKFAPEGMISSSFKTKLRNLAPGEKLWVTQLHGSFTLPQDPKTPLVLIAGGIGITPFVSMVRDLLRKGEKRDLTIFVANKKEADIPYRELFDEAEMKLGVRVVHILSDKAPEGWQGEVGFLAAQMLAKYVEDPKAPTYYLSGPSAMVDNYKVMLIALGVASDKIKTDYFPGFA